MSDIVRGKDGHFLPGTGVKDIERLREMGRHGAAITNAKKALASKERVDELLRDCGIEGGYEAASSELKVLAEKAAGGDVPAMRLLLSQTGNIVKAEKTESPGQNWNPESGDPCPVCGGQRVTIMLDDASTIYLAEVINATPVEIRTIPNVAI